jgi:predicted HTH transcriptional regulator
MSNHAESLCFPLLIDNLAHAVSSYEKQKAEKHTDVNLPPRQAAQAKEIRQAVYKWLAENGPATAAEVAGHFQYHATTAHSYLNRLANDGQVRIINRRNRRIFVAEES